jgi:hypothetical protein
VTHQHHTPVPTAVRSRNRLTACSALVALAAITVTAGCSSDNGDRTTASPAPSSAQPTTTVSADETKARKAVLAAYHGMTDEQVKAYAEASLAGSDITKYATGNALRDVKDAVFVNMQNGIVVKGEPEVIAGENDVTLDTTSKPPRAFLKVCFDTNTWEPVDKKTGKSVAPPNQVKRYTITAQLQQQGSQWLVTDEKADKERTC